jgi:hypothetical protein
LAKLEDVKTPYLNLEEQATTPTTPTTGLNRLYFKTDGKPYYLDDAGVEHEFGGTATSTEHTTRGIAFYIDGDLTTSLVASFVAPFAMTITNVRASVGTAPTGVDLILDIHKNDVTIFTTQANRPTIAAGATSVNSSTSDVTSIAVGDRITLCIDQVGSTVAGANLAATIVCEVV